MIVNLTWHSAQQEWKPCADDKEPLPFRRGGYEFWLVFEIFPGGVHIYRMSANEIEPDIDEYDCYTMWDIGAFRQPPEGTPQNEIPVYVKTKADELIERFLNKSSLI